MNPDVLITSCAVVPDVREIRVSPSSIISLEDDLMRLFGSEKSDEHVSTHWVFRKVSRSSIRCLPPPIEKAQKKIEGNNFGIRKNLLEYDQVMNEQREIIYEERRRVLDGESMRDAIYQDDHGYSVENVVDTCIR